MEIQIATEENGGLGFIFERATGEGWEPGLQDLSIYQSIDPNGLFVGIVDTRIVACISAIRFEGNAYGFIGYYIVTPEERRKGYGLQLFKHAMDYLGTRNIGLDAALEQEPNYQKSGFTSYHLTERYCGTVRDKHCLVAGEGVVPLSTVPLADILRYDARHFPAPRVSWINKWIDGSIEGCRSFACVQDGSMTGMGVMRLCETGYKVGPIYADTELIAEGILQALQLEMEDGGEFHIDAPVINSQAAVLMQRLGLKYLLHCRRMYTNGEPPGLDWSGVYGISSLELG